MKTGLVYITYESDEYERQGELLQVPHLGLGSIASYIEGQGFPCELISFRLSGGENEKAIGDFALESFDVLGFSLYTQNYRPTIALAKALKIRKPGLKIILGGPHATWTHEDLIRNHEEISAVCRHEGEKSFLELLQAIKAGESFHGISGVTFRDNGAVRAEAPGPPLDELDSLPFPRRTFTGASRSWQERFNRSTFRTERGAVIITSRGCPFLCAFCAITAGGKNHWSARSSRSVEEEARKVKALTGATHFYALDANFLVDPLRALAIGRAFKGLCCTFSFAARADQVAENGKLMGKLRELGCSMIEVGIESGSQAVLDRYRKGTKVAQNERAIAVLREHGIRLGFDFLMFMPTLTFDELCESFAFIRRNGLYGTEPFETLAKRVELYPGTALRGEWERLNGPSDPHSLPRYHFGDGRIEALYQGIREFMDRYYFRARERAALLRKALFPLEALIAGNPGLLERPSRRFIGKCLIECDIQNRIAFRFFEEALSRCASGKGAAPDEVLSAPHRERIEGFLSEFPRVMEAIMELQVKYGSHLE
ncbi:MAG: radical SAM protein [Candidatus Eremiobacteraeota bacterium]|nr:radical SAM protein [Candidatus Eremiobacteraeota bacterium]